MKQSNEIKILIVDDSPTIRHQIKSLLSKSEFKLFEAENGSMALKKAKMEQPDIMLMDVQMPKMNGFQCCEQIKAHPELKHIRVIMVTGETGYENLSHAYRMGCNDYINKPINEQELMEKLNRVARFVRISRTAKCTLAQRKDKSSTPPV